jgi:hypothetical protein
MRRLPCGLYVVQRLGYRQGAHNQVPAHELGLVHIGLEQSSECPGLPQRGANVRAELALVAIGWKLDDETDRNGVDAWDSRDHSVASLGAFCGG